MNEESKALPPKVTITFSINVKEYVALMTLKKNKGYRSWKKMFVGECLE